MPYFWQMCAILWTPTVQPSGKSYCFETHFTFQSGNCTCFYQILSLYLYWFSDGKGFKIALNFLRCSKLFAPTVKPRGTSGSSPLRSDGSLDRQTGRLDYRGVAKGKTRGTTIVEPTHLRWFSGIQVEKAGLREQQQKDIQEKPKDQGGLPRLKSTQIRWFLW